MRQVRHTLQHLVQRQQVSPISLQDMVFITGKGGGVAGSGGRPDSQKGVVAAGFSASAEGGAAVGTEPTVEPKGWRAAQRHADRSFNLRKQLMDALRTDYDPPLRAEAAKNMPGCVVIPRESLQAWAGVQEAGPEVRGATPPLPPATTTATTTPTSSTSTPGSGGT